MVAGILAVAWGQVPILLWAAGIAGIAGIAMVWSRSAWNGVTVDIGFDPERAFIGEPTHVVVKVVNAKGTPLPIVRIQIRLPEGLVTGASSREAAADPTAFRGHRIRLSIGGRSEATVRLPVHVSGRGEYWLEAVHVEIADPFDLAPVRRELDPDRPLLVMPQPMSGTPLRVRRWLPFGSPAPGARLFEDREHFAGMRDYEPGDPMHHVHWRASAHAGRLQTKKFEPTRSAEILLALDLADGEPFWEAVDPDAAEETIAWASYLARQAVHAGWRAGLVANTHLRKGRGPLRVPAAASAGQEAALFTALARMPSQPTNDLGPVLREVGRGLTRRTTVVVLSPNPGPTLRRQMEVLRRKGSDVLLLVPGTLEAGAAS